MKSVLLPELGEGIDKAVVAYWHYKEGQDVAENDDLVELVTDKASFNVPAGCKGKVQKILFKEGEEAKVGDILALIDS